MFPSSVLELVYIYIWETDPAGFYFIYEYELATRVGPCIRHCLAHVSRHAAMFSSCKRRPIKREDEKERQRDEWTDRERYYKGKACEGKREEEGGSWMVHI